MNKTAQIGLSVVLLCTSFGLTTYSQWTASGTNIYNTNTGNVGIGATSPTFKLQVAGNGKYFTSSGYVEVSPGSTTSLELGSNGSSTQIDFKSGIYMSNDFRGRIVYTEGSGFGFQTNGSTTDRFVITSSGYVGVGITPSFPYSFQVEGAFSKFTSGNGYFSISPSNGSLEIGAASGNTTTIDFHGYSNLSVDYVGRIKYEDGVGMKMYTGAHTTPDLFINENGKITIGNVSDASSDFKLFVQTGILTEKVKVAISTSVDWADYVFAPDYELMSLENVADYINNNCHLPEVPSADEVVKNGVDLGKMDATLLQKIEELTLYMIQLNEENKELKARIEQLETNQ